MKNKTVRQISRKAPKGRVGQVSTGQRVLADHCGASGSMEVIKLGVDTHAGQYTFARMIDNLNAQPPQSLAPDVFLQFLARQKSLARRVVMVYEAGPYGFSLYRQASELGVECLVCAPERLSRGRKCVNDKIDARELLSRLDRWLAGNTTALRLVSPPTIQRGSGDHSKGVGSLYKDSRSNPVRHEYCDHRKRN